MNKEEFVKKLEACCGDSSLMPKIFVNPPEIPMDTPQSEVDKIYRNFEIRKLWDFLVDNGIINEKSTAADKILLVEDGSVDVDILKTEGVKVLVYRQGATKPEWL